MKTRIFLTTILLTAFFFSCKSQQSDNLSWDVNLESAISKAQSENKYILVNFTGSDWCIWCKRLSNEVFSQKEFKEFADDNLILVMIDFTKNIEQSPETKIYNQQLLQQFAIEGFPTIFILDKDGNERLRTGYLPGGAVNYINHLKQYM